MKTFLSLFWGKDAGFYCIAEKTAKGMLHRYYQSVDEAVSDILVHRDSGTNLYFSPAVYRTAKRLQSCVKSVSAFWLDIDCAEEKAYQSQQEGLDALAEFLIKTKLPMPYIVSSGRGLHVYWVLKDPLEPSLWTQYAERLKSLCALYGLKADPSRTSDSASLLRPVGTYNRKSNDLPQVHILKHSKEFTLDDFNILKTPVVAGDKTAEDEVGVIAPDFPDSDVETVLGKCPTLKHIADKRGAVEEPLWRAFLSVIFRCTNGAKWCHDLSKGDPRYSFAETQKKAEGTKGPYTCTQFCSLASDTCARCPFRGKITSPIVLGYQHVGYEPKQDTPKTDDTTTPTSRLTKTEHYIVKEGGVLKISDEHSFYITRSPLWVRSVREKSRIRDEDGESSVTIEWETLTGRLKVASLPQEDLYEKRTFTKWLAMNNLRALIKDVSELQGYVMECIVELMRLNLVEQYYDTLGWSSDGFVLGKRIITPAGVNPASMQTSSSVSFIKARGSKEKWVQATAVLADPSLWQTAFAVLCGFASPLLSLCHYQAAVVSLFGSSGYGKTLAGSLALSIYGDPTLLMQAASATTNAIGKQMAAHKNVPYLLDEVSNMPPYKLADFIYDAANGRQKEVLDKNRDLRQGPGWCLVPFISSNHSVMEMSTMYIQDAHRRRVIEVPFTTPISARAAGVIAEAYQDNYGTVADDYLSYVIANKSSIRDSVDNVLRYQSFQRIPTVNRFGKWTIACAAVAGDIAKKLGLIEFDPEAVINKALDSFSADVIQITDEADIARSTIVGFLYENAFAINVWSSATPNSVSLTAARQLFARYDPAKDMYYIQKGKYDSLLREAGLSLRSLSTWQANVGIKEDNIKLAEAFPIARCMAIPATAINVKIDQIVGGDNETRKTD